MIWFNNMPKPDMQHNLQPEPNRRRLSLEIPGLSNMSCTEILALANNTDAYGTSSSVGASSSSLSTQYSMDSWINSWRMEYNPLFSNSESSLGINTGIPGQRTMPTQQYDVSTQQRFLCDLILTPEEMMSTSLRPTEAEFPPITLERPARMLVETDHEPHDPIKKSILETGSRVGVKRGRPRNNEKGQLKTPASKKKKIRPKVVGEGKTNKASSSKPRVKKSSAATATPAPAPPPAATAACGLDFPSEGHTRGEGPTDRTLVKQSPRDPTTSQINARVLDLQWRRQCSQGTSFADMWERSSTIDAITKLFDELNINIEGLCLPHNRETALTLYKKTYEEQQALVKYSQKQKPKVQLDPVTNRVWKLLMRSIHNNGVDGADEKTRKWWKEQINMLCGLISSFIDQMRRVQGDRTFSPWKGSVVDSVVGVFLTQNVADHLSSSAYMDLAAAFPLDCNFNKRSSPEEWGSSVTHETMMNPRIRNPNCVIIEEIDDDDDEHGTDAVCSQGPSKMSESFISSTNQSTMMLQDPFNTSLVSEQVDSKMVKGKGHLPNTGGLSMVSYTSSHFNLNELPPEVESCDSFINNDYEESQVQHMSSHQQELESTLHAQDQEQNTRTEDVQKKKPTTSRPVGRPRKNKVDESSSNKKAKEPAKSKPEDTFDWDILRKEAESGGKKREKTERTRDTVDWEAVRCADVNKIANIIIKRGFNNLLAGRIKAFLNRLVEDHGSIDLEWLRDVPPDKAKEYLLSINGLGLKSVECVRLLSLHQVAFPVDTNVGRIAVRLGWVPLQPLPDELQMHLLEQYPVLDSVQRYLWPRLCKLDQKTLYELHYHMITFGKVFCTKITPNCNACPMKAECRHYASAQRLLYPQNSIVT
ncbi:PREDICTED: DEMETER-like protein 2 [Camelina sativa]|uniref:DEMETER-like protein 2 n=1 Tax=Camelina sativa TaxID=90675 RepID=A0ABM0WAH9_CAMSA|nr:PREDICTED: DEMETER-like protein 2 [Camelina sativa]